MTMTTIKQYMQLGYTLDQALELINDTLVAELIAKMR